MHSHHSFDSSVMVWVLSAMIGGLADIASRSIFSTMADAIFVRASAAMWSVWQYRNWIWPLLCSSAMRAARTAK